jgi:hypothetical protein
MRIVTSRIEQLSARRFIEIVALIAGVFVGMPQILAGSSGNPVPAALVATLAIAGLTATLALWWIAVRRRQFSVWRTAWHITLALAMGDFIGFAVAFLAATVQTNGDYAEAYFHASWLTTLPGLVVPMLLRSPIRFVGTATLVALGRMPRDGEPRLESKSPALTP